MMNFYRLFTNKSTASFTKFCVSSPFSKLSRTQCSRFVLTIKPIARSIALREAANWVTTSLQSFPCSIIVNTPLICPSIRRKRFLIF
ncbi:Hypothetical protein A7A1_0813 [Bacillus subtilis subsp. subtilis str. BSP1]|nr:Hypothetical protein A7A1_0813 [Bacillus subtilis subsp. subtilis str. BSP1]